MEHSESSYRFASQFTDFRCSQYDLTIIRYSFNVLEASIVQYMVDNYDDRCEDIQEAIFALNKLLQKILTVMKSGDQLNSKYDMSAENFMNPMNAMNSSSNQIDRSMNMLNANRTVNGISPILKSTNMSGQNKTLHPQVATPCKSMFLQGACKKLTSVIDSNQTTPQACNRPLSQIPANCDLGLILPGQSPLTRMMYNATEHLNLMDGSNDYRQPCGSNSNQQDRHFSPNSSGNASLNSSQYSNSSSSGSASLNSSEYSNTCSSANTTPNSTINNSTHRQSNKARKVLLPKMNVTQHW